MEEAKHSAPAPAPAAALLPSISMGFWSAFAELKLTTLKLDQSPLRLEATYNFPSSGQPLLEFDESSLIDHDPNKFQTKGGYLRCRAPGALMNYNTYQAFKAAAKDPKSNTQTETGEIQRIQKSLPNSQYILFAFSDLKNFKFSFFLSSLAASTFDVLEFAPLAKSSLSPDTLKEIEKGLTDIRKENGGLSVMPQYLNKFIPDSTYILLDPSADTPSELVPLLLSKMGCEPGQEVELLLLRDKITAIQRKPEEVVELGDKSRFLRVAVKGVKEPRSGGVKAVDLKQFLDPEELAAQAVTLNLNLMKWRAAPSLDLSFAEDTKCLLFGSGSLGCQVARQLLAWGFSKVTLVDNGKVSYSNPVRQSLFEFKDAEKGDAKKSETAKAALERINPRVEASSVVMTIPMPGHPPAQGQEEEALAQATQIRRLVEQHDVVFLLTDNRESRWLPTLLCAILDKICITVALGFDTFVVMRHGHRGGDKEELGCYFCGDIVAPHDSMRDRTLDQQCTVSRPALCPMASAIAVELLVSLLNHPLKGKARAHEELHESDTSVLGPLPQQIRGNLHNFGLNALCGYSFDKCVACSGNIRAGYLEDPRGFVLNALQNADFLEDVSGITAMKQELEGVDVEEFLMDD